MNKVDIIVMRIKACKSFEEAIKKIMNPVEEFGYKLTKTETNFSIHYARLYFSNR